MENSASKLGELNHAIMAYIKQLHQKAANKKNKLVYSYIIKDYVLLAHPLPFCMTNENLWLNI